MNNRSPNLSIETSAESDANPAADSQAPTSADQPVDLASIPPAKALELFTQNPVAFIHKIVGDAAESHLVALKEQAELHGAISAFRKTHPEFQRFEAFILQEAANLLQQDDSVATNPWSQILEKAMENFKQKFTQTLQENPLPATGNAPNPPYMEGAGNRAIVEAPLMFTREQIGKMSMQDFLKNEAAINEALKNNRIQ